MSDYQGMTDEELTAELVELDAEMDTARDAKRPVVAELRRREEERRLVNLAKRFTGEELAAMQSIQARGFDNPVTFGKMGG